MKKCKLVSLLLISFLSELSFGIQAQDPTRFSKQVHELTTKEYTLEEGKELVVFTGSSSIVRWESVQYDFPDYNVINNGFGGSQFSDLLFYYNELILT